MIEYKFGDIGQYSERDIYNFHYIQQTFLFCKSCQKQIPLDFKDNPICNECIRSRRNAQFERLEMELINKLDDVETKLIPIAGFLFLFPIFLINFTDIRLHNNMVFVLLVSAVFAVIAYHIGKPLIQGILKQRFLEKKEEIIKQYPLHK